MPEDPDRLEREINEILNKIEQFPSPERRRARAARRSVRRFGDGVSSRQRAIVRELSRISPSQLILLSFLMILGSFMIRGIGPIGTWIMIAGIVLLLASLAVMAFGGGRSRQPETQKWRGRTIEYRQDSLSQRLRRWFGSRKTR